MGDVTDSIELISFLMRPSVQKQQQHHQHTAKSGRWGVRGEGGRSRSERRSITGQIWTGWTGDKKGQQQMHVGGARRQKQMSAITKDLSHHIIDEQLHVFGSFPIRSVQFHERIPLTIKQNADNTSRSNKNEAHSRPLNRFRIGLCAI